VDIAVEAHSARQARCDIGGEAASLVVMKNLLELMHPAQIASAANPIAIALNLDHVQHVLGFVGTWLVAQHARDGQGVFIIGPAIHRGEIDHWGLDSIIHFQGVVLIGDAEHFPGHPNGAIGKWQGAPIFAFGLGDD
jgi:hypothetical protein